jgi:hypothetical protein
MKINDVLTDKSLVWIDLLLVGGRVVHRQLGFWELTLPPSRGQLVQIFNLSLTKL